MKISQEITRYVINNVQVAMDVIDEDGKYHFAITTIKYRFLEDV